MAMAGAAGRMDSTPADGAIYQTGTAFRPLFDDIRARQVGDVLTIVLNEKTAASLQCVWLMTSCRVLANCQTA